MSNSSNRIATKLRRSAPLFAALGDETRLTLLAKLGQGESLSISQLCAGETVTRQAITKHLDVLQEAGLVQDKRQGRERRFALQRKSLEQAQASLATISAQWDDALERLKAYAEKDI